MTGLWNALGYVGLTLFMAGLATAGMVFVWLMCDGSGFLRAFAVVLGAATAAVFWSPRPQMLSFFLSAVVLWLLMQFVRRGHDRLWALPIIMAIWGNLHAGFSIGLLLMAGVIAGETLANIFAPNRNGSIGWRGVRRLVVVSLISVAALCINPYGLQMLAVPFQTIGIGALRNFIQEWNSPNFHEAQVLPFLALLLLTFGAAGASRIRLTWTDFVLLAGTGYLAFTAGRNIALFAVVATPVFTVHANNILAERGWVLRQRRTVSPVMGFANLVIIVVICAAVALKFVSVVLPRPVDQALADTFPVEAVQVMRDTDVPTNLLNSYNWGGYLVYAAPEWPVFVDGRTDLYGDAFLSDTYLTAVTAGEGFRDILDRYRINTVLIEPNSGLARALADDPDWRTAYRDERSVLLVRQTPVVRLPDATA
jgi:hypothetical protein